MLSPLFSLASRMTLGKWSRALGLISPHLQRTAMNPPTFAKALRLAGELSHTSCLYSLLVVITACRYEYFAGFSGLNVDGCPWEI